MSALADAMNHAALGWVKPELDETLRQARAEIEAFAEAPSDTGRMRFCAGYLHQVQGTLRMVELYAPAMVAEELELLAQAVQAGRIEDRDEACAMLMRGTVLLPDYLERLQNGHRDIPIVLLPLLNEIRAARGEPGLSESVLFAFNPDAGNATPAELEHARGSLSGRNRELLDTVGNAVKEELLRVKDALDLHLRTGGEPAELQAQVAELGAVADTLGMMGLGVARNVVVQQRDALRRIVDGQQAIDEGLLLDIAGALLYVDASLDDQVANLGAYAEGGDDAGASANASEVRRTVEVLAHEAIANFAAAREHFVAFIETNWDHARLADVPALLDEVGGAMRILDLPQPADYLEGVRRYVQHELIDKRRIPSGRQLDTLADAMASLEYYLEALRERRPGREEILDITRNSLETLRYWPLPVATAAAEPQWHPAPATAVPAVAAQAEATLAMEAWTLAPAEPERGPADVAAPGDAPAEAAGSAFSFDPVAAEEALHGLDGLPQAQVAPIDLSVDGGQAPAHWRNDFAGQGAAPSAFDPVAAEYVEHPPAGAEEIRYTFDAAALDDVPAPAVAELPARAYDALAELAAPEAAAITPPFLAEVPVDAVFVGEPQADAAEPDEAVPVPAPADVAGADGEAVQPLAIEEDNPFVERIEAVPVPDAEPASSAAQPGVHEAVIGKIELDEAARAFLAELDAAAAGFSLDEPEAPEEAEPTPAEPVAAAPLAVQGGFEDSGGEIDDDIREVFLEEFDEELANLSQLLPVWLAAPGSLDNLRPIRRVFHTLKGSGRLVGASTLGEFSWKIEGMLNRVLDGTRPPSPAVVAMVEQAYAVLPQLNAALRHGTPVHADLMAMEAVADRIGAGEETFYVPHADADPVGPVQAAEGTPASVDSVLREILEAEVATHLETVHAWLQASQVEPQPATEALLRAVHTMSGAFAMTDVPEITSVTLPAESYVKRALAAGVTPSHEGVEGLGATASAISATIDALQAESPRVPSFAALATRMRGLADSLPEAQWPLQHFDEEAELEAEPASVPEQPGELTGVEDLSAYLDESALAAAEIHAPLPVEPAESVEPAASLPVEPLGFPAAGAEAFLDAPEAPAEIETEAETDAEAAAIGDAPAIAQADDGASDADPADADAFGEVEDITLEAPEFVGSEEHVADVAFDASSIAGEPANDADGGIPFDRETAAAAPGTVIHEDQAQDEPHAGLPAVAEFAGLSGVAIEHGQDDAPADLRELAEVAEEALAAEGYEEASDLDAHAAFDVAEPPAIDAPADMQAAVEAEAATAEADPNDLGPLDFQELDSELVDIFVEEGKDLLDHCDSLLAGLRETPDERELLIGLQRDLHTLKGGARMAGINAIGDLGHGIESLLEAVAAQRTALAREDVGLLERGFDRLHRLLVLTGQHRAVAMPVDLIEAFEARTQGRGEPAVEAPVAFARPRPAAELVEPAPLSAPVPLEPQPEEELLPRVQQEQVRVRADLLDSLVNHAGEVAIYRSRLEQQLGAFRGAMAELDRTNVRLRDQLRRLDLETEAQIVARYQREQEHGDRDFDPLELDRFSTLQQLSRALNESAADLAGLQGVLDDLARQYDSLLQQQSRVSSELQEGLMRARMVPFDGLVPRLRRVVRQAAGETGKQVQLVLDGTHGELDRNVLDRMVAPLEHMLRNAVAHGLEAPHARRAAGKPEEGTITLRLRREGSEIVLEVADDGAGLDREAIRRRGEQRGLVAPGEALADSELDELIFASGFSTSEQVSQLAGRGVGMDVVRNEVRQLGGSVDIHSVRGEGVTFTLRLPQTLAVTQAVFVRIGETTFAVPVASVSGIGRIARARYDSGEGGYRYGGEDYTLYDLGTLVGQAAATADGAAQVPLLLVRSGELRAAVAIDQVLGNREIVVKPVGLQIASVPGIYGATITGDGRVVVILDVAPLVRRHLAQPARPVIEAPAEVQRIAPLVMVVDDSLTMRKVTGRVLERHNLEVVTARDGVEALEKLEERIPDLMLLDIEMPRMDGYELATAMRADARFKAVPIVMITSRSGDKHRQRAFEIGVQRYLGKPYQELDLMRNVYDLLGIARVRE
ncbi:Hpt domain-containing protein [[Pseudomonas] boreopolis]|uniref:hybrid sensor histidine kinase/response regulator n=1 Tax=Xanthomonas boreopolis TaxID=86183 RepID=UPI003D9AF105